MGLELTGDLMDFKLLGDVAGLDGTVFFSSPTVVSLCGELSIEKLDFSVGGLSDDLIQLLLRGSVSPSARVVFDAC